MAIDPGQLRSRAGRRTRGEDTRAVCGGGYRSLPRRQHGEEIALPGVVAGDVQFAPAGVRPLRASCMPRTATACHCGHRPGDSIGQYALAAARREADFAVCGFSYKYLNAGQGADRRLFVHKRNAKTRSRRTKKNRNQNFPYHNQPGAPLAGAATPPAVRATSRRRRICEERQFRARHRRGRRQVSNSPILAQHRSSPRWRSSRGRMETLAGESSAASFTRFLERLDASAARASAPHHAEQSGRARAVQL